MGGDKMTNPQKPKYEIGYVNPKTLRDELRRVVASGEYPKYDTQSARKTYVITRDSLKGLVLRYIREIKEKAENKGKCVWKNVAGRDLEKLANGDSFITLSLDKRCYMCDETKKYARKINCDAYHKDAEK